MAVDVTITGNGRFSGARSNIGSYSVTEEATPVLASDSSGGVGSITFNAVDDPSRFGSMLLMNDEVTLEDGDRGLVVGLINSLNSNNRMLSVTADSRLGKLVGERRAEMAFGTFENAIIYYLGLAGITTDIAVDESLRENVVFAPGFVGDLWVKIKELLVVNHAEITVVRGNIVVRPIRSRRAMEINNVSESWSISNGELSETVEVAYYNPSLMINGPIYPAGGWNEEVPIYTVDAGEIQEINIPIDGWVTSLVQPVPMDYVSKNETASVYSITGSDGKPITATQWTATGGSLTVKPGEDGKSIDVTLVGATGASEKLAPFRVAMSSGDSNTYSSLRLRGSGMIYDRKTVVVYTGAGPQANSDSAPTVDNIYVRTIEEAYSIAAEVAGSYSSPVRTLNISKADINKPGSSDNSYNYVTFGQNDEHFEDLNLVTFADFDAYYAGKPFSFFDNYWYEQVEDNFDFQVFGNASGARIQFRRAMYRIRSVTTTENSVDYTAEADTTFGDFDKTTEGMTFAQFDAAFIGTTFTDFSLAPLLNTDPEYDH